MARLIPSEPTGNVRPPVARMFRLVKALPDTFTAWIALEEDALVKPHFMLVWKECYGFLIQVAETTQQLAESALQQDFLVEPVETLSADTLGQSETDVIERFAKRVHEELGLPANESVPVRRLVVFPNVEVNTINEIVLQRAEESETSFLGCHQLGEGKFAQYLERFATEALPELSLTIFRKHFTPESKIPRHFSPLTPPDRNTAASLTDMLIDFDQEAVTKAELNLPPESESVVSDLSARLVTGVAGSGKSLILIIRALLMARLNKDARLLVLTHNRPLNGELKQRFRHLAGAWPHFEWMTYFQWVKHCLPDDALPHKILSGRPLEDIARSAAARHPELTSFNLAFLIDELNWIKDQRFHERRTYLEAKRQGRVLPLSPKQRESMRAFFRDYQLGLEREGATDWSGVAMRFWKMAIHDQSITLPSYDGIFADEAQFFAPAWFDCVKTSLRPGGQLFLCADPTQGFLKRRQSWLASGIEVRGRTVKLIHSYRNSRAILKFAKNFYQSRLGEEQAEEALNLPTSEQLAAAPELPHVPIVEVCGSPQDVQTRLIHEIKQLVDHDLRPGSILVMHRSYTALENIHQRLTRELGPNQSQLLQNASRPAPEPLIGMTTLNAGTGLEAPIVFLLGCDELIERESDLKLSQEERTALCRDHTRQLYMSMTRAARQLVILCHQKTTAKILRRASGRFVDTTTIVTS